MFYTQPNGALEHNQQLNSFMSLLSILLICISFTSLRPNLLNNLHFRFLLLMVRSIFGVIDSLSYYLSYPTIFSLSVYPIPILTILIIFDLLNIYSNDQ